MPSRPTRRRLIGATSLALTLGLGATACGSSEETETGTEGLTTVTFAMDYFPGPAHNGLAWAIQEGMFEDAGIDVELLPFTDSPPDSLIASGAADLGINWGATYSLSDFAQGMPVTAVFALYQHYPAKLAVLADSDIDSPADMAGKKLGTFGDPFDPTVTNTMIEADGGDGEVTPVTVGTSVYQALSSKKIDGFLIYASDQYEFESLSGAEVRTFDPVEYGVPDSYGNMVLANNDFLADEPQIAKAFMEVFTEAYRHSLAETAETNDALEEQFPDAQINRDLVDYVTDIQSKWLFIDDAGNVGVNDMARWEETLAYTQEAGLLVDEAGDPFEGELDLKSFVTNEYIPDA